MDPARKHDEEVEQLSREMARVVERAAPEDRDELRDYAAELLRNGTESEPTRVESGPRSKQGALLGVGLLMLVMGLGLMILVPPVGAVITVFAGVLVLLGGAGVLARLVPEAIRHLRREPEAPGEESGSPTE